MLNGFPKDVAEAADDEVDLGTEEEGSPQFPQTCLVLRLSPTIRPEALRWLVNKIRGRKRDGGAELLVRREPALDNDPDQGVNLHVTASRIKFLEVAEALELRKRDIAGRLREFTVADMDSFLCEGAPLDDLLGSADRQMMVSHELENMRATDHENHIPGYQNAELYAGQPILHMYMKEELIRSMYPLHENEMLKKFASKWYWALFQSQPFEDIRAYFGEAVAMYFNFLGFYTAALVIPTVLGLFFWLVAPETPYILSIFCVINLMWATIFLEMWKRHCSVVAYGWGTLTLSKWEEPRPNYHGPQGKDPVTGRIQPIYPSWKSTIKVYCGSMPVLLVLLYVNFRIMIFFLNMEESLMEQKSRSGSQLAGILAYLPSIGYTVFVLVANLGYQWLADVLTEWENHKTQTKFDNHRTVKLVAFEFLNTFMSLFYIAFYLQDMDQLRSQLLTMSIVHASINQFAEAILPCVLRDAYNKADEVIRSYLSRVVEKKPTLGQSCTELIDGSYGYLDLEMLDKDDLRIQLARTEADKEPYLSTYDDYLELFLQFGYVFLFSAVSPLASMLALANNVLEIRADAYKLCCVFQRPIPKRVKNIGAWQRAFEGMGFLAVVTNSALLFVSPQMRSLAVGLNDVHWLLLFVVVEHALLFAITALHILIPDVPKAVADALKRQEYLSHLALRREQSNNSRRQLSRRFKSIHVPRMRTKTDDAYDLRRRPLHSGSRANFH